MKLIGEKMRYSIVTMILLLTSCGQRQTAEAPSLPDPLPPLAAWKPSIELADKALSNGGPAVALRVTDELLVKNPRNVDALVRRGDALAAMGRGAEAATAYGSVIDSEPRNTRALMGLGRVRLTQDPAAAEVLFARITGGDRKDAAALNDLGVARDMQRHHAAAQEAYRQALKVAPASVPAQVNLAVSLALSGEAAAAMRMLQPLAAAPGAALDIRHDLALALTLDGQKAKASSMLGQDLAADDVSRALSGYEALRL